LEIFIVEVIAVFVGHVLKLQIENDLSSCLQQAPPIMEVHHHAHTARKKWTHYLWEFLMLFLAVFCGFLAENFREHQVEHNREKKFMASL